MEWKVSFYRMNAFYISLLTIKSSIAFGTVLHNRVSSNTSNVLYLSMISYEHKLYKKSFDILEILLHESGPFRTLTF
jgi:hypothetical protein